jgi:penicillin V acylase-like amidase (Ntn superfamily)
MTSALRRGLLLAVVLLYGCGMALPCTDTAIPAGPVKVSARTMDFPANMQSKIIIRPRGIERVSFDSTPGTPALKWTAAHGSVTVRVFIDEVTADGMNEVGLSAAMLWLNDTKYPLPDDRPVLSLNWWAQYLLDTCANVAEAVERAQTVRVAGAALPGVGPVNIHLVLRDAQGDSALLEYVDGQLVVHHPLAQPAVTNEPPYTQMLERLAEYEGFGGKLPLPGGLDPVSRFVRVNSYAGKLPPAQNPNQAAAYAFALVQLACQPPGTPAPTLWTVCRDHTNLVYSCRTINSPDVVRIDFRQFDLSPGQKQQVIELHADPQGDTGK